jgi:hypothetical protein
MHALRRKPNTNVQREVIDGSRSSKEVEFKSVPVRLRLNQLMLPPPVMRRPSVSCSLQDSLLWYTAHR